VAPGKKFKAILGHRLGAPFVNQVLSYKLSAETGPPASRVWAQIQSSQLSITLIPVQGLTLENTAFSLKDNALIAHPLSDN
jgi:hypothetical protein